MAKRQGAFTTTVPVRAGQLEGLRDLLGEIGADVNKNRWLPFPEISTLHFGRFVIVPGVDDPKAASLVFSTNFDVPLDKHLDQLLSVAGAGIDRIYGHCEGYPLTGSATPELVKDFWKHHRLEPQTYFSGTYRRTLAEIRRQSELHNVISEIVDDLNRDPTPWQQDPREIRDEILRIVRQRYPAQAWAIDTPPPVPEEKRIRFQIAKLAAWIRVIGRGLALLPFLPMLFVLARRDAKQYRLNQLDPEWVADRKRRADNARKFNTANADRFIQNEMTHLSVVKPGVTRQLAIRFALEFIGLQARFWYREGSLGGIPSIHFARWVLIDGGRRLLFLTQFDGSWDLYLNDFIDQNGKGVAAMWSNTEDFPPTRGLWSLIPPPNVPDIKLWARSEQILTEVWYSAYPTLTVQNINNNSVVRNGCTGTMTREQAAAWLQRL